MYDDIKKFFDVKKTGFFGLKMWHKLILQLVLATTIALLIYFQLGIHILNVPFFGTWDLGWGFIPFVVFVIVAFTNAVNITDGMDGLAGGILLFSLLGLWVISMSILDMPIAIFVGLWIGALVAFLYFNVYPARIFMGDSGALAFGATFAVIGILLGKTIALVVMGLIFVVEIASSLIQLLSKKFRHKKVFPVTPFHLYLRNLGWEEPKVVQRLWLAQIILTFFGIWLTLL
jgi:phospho-N-acetylmuramoyl-pentapeptide-transferase